MAASQCRSEAGNHVTADLVRCLNRTLLLMRDEFGETISDCRLLEALTDLRVALIADGSNISSHAAQTTFVTAALLMARSGHKVFLMAPDVEMIAPQPPLRSGKIINQLTIVGNNILPNLEFAVGEPDGEVDLAIGLGDSPIRIRSRRKIRLNATAWSGSIAREDQPYPWQAALWPFGALAAAGLGAGEAFKMAMYKLLPYAARRASTAAVFAPVGEARFQLALDDTPLSRDLGQVDCISGGAITNSILYCLARIPGVTAYGRIIEPDTADFSNLNRNMLLLRSSCEPPSALKASDLASTLCPGLCFEPVAELYDSRLAATIQPLAPSVLVGVDDIPTRWLIQEASPSLLIVGATSHWSAMASFHSPGIGCAQCLHDKDHRGNDLIPTTACVSFWAGLLSAAYLARHAAGENLFISEQQVFLTPFRPEAPFSSPVAKREGCPTCLQISNARARSLG